jgi:DNA repair protein RecN (Recombination protein N)
MLRRLSLRDVVLFEALDLEFGPGLTALTGETGAGKSIILDGLGLALGARADSGLVRHGGGQAVATAVFEASPEHRVWAILAERDMALESGEDLVLRRTLSVDGRSRAFVNDQPVSAQTLRALAEALVEVHGQHDTTGLLDQRTHRGLLDARGGAGLAASAGAAATAWGAWRTAQARAEALAEAHTRDAAEAEELAKRLADLDRLAPKAGEEAVLAETRTVLGAAEKILSDIAQARDLLASSSAESALAQGLRALERAQERLAKAGAAGVEAARLSEAAQAFERALVEVNEAAGAIDAAAQAFTFDADALEQAETRLFALRAAARSHGVEVEALPALREQLAARLGAIDLAESSLVEAQDEAARAAELYRQAARQLSSLRHEVAAALTEAVMNELAPLKLEKARFAVEVETLEEGRWGPGGTDRVTFRIATIPGAPLADLNAVASGGELSRIALALKAALAGEASPPLMIFDEVDQGVGGAVADAVGLRLKRLAKAGQVLVVTHSPQIAARAEAHWRVVRSHDGGATRVDVLSGEASEEEIARMLSGAAITEAARAAARALINA